MAKARGFSRFFVEFIVKGLAWHHWKLLLGQDYLVLASFITTEGQHFFDPLIDGTCQNRVKCCLGDGIFKYEGVQSKECPELTMWRMSLYGAEVGGDPGNSSARCSVVYGITAPKAWPVTEKLMTHLRSGNSPISPNDIGCS
jgi:hypothetical protein